jgi:hypothetical protein
MKAALFKFGPWALVALAAIGWVRCYGDARASEALALARADSLAWAQERHDSLEVGRDSLRAELAQGVAAHDSTADSLRGVARRADSSSRINLGRLAAILADTADAAVPDTVRVIVREVVAGLEEARNVCEARLRTCRATRLLLASRIRTDSASIAEKDLLLVEFGAQLEDAIEHRRRPAGVLRWLERGLVAYAILRIGSDLLGGGSK